MRKTYSLLLLFFIAANSFAQNVFTLSGSIVNRKNRPVAFANVVLYNQTDSSMVNGVTSNSEGKFSFKNLPAGDFYLSILFIGFKPSTVTNIKISEEDINLGKLVLRRKPTQLEEITVVSEKGMFETQAGKTIYNVDGNIAATGELADELLQNIPSVSVDMDNKVTVRGAKATVLIDGIESSLSDMLDQIPADAVESIEVMSNPSVRYESKKGGSIINIKLKKQAGKGYNGKLSGGIGSSEKRDLNLKLGQNSKKWRYSGSFNYQHKLQETLQNGERITTSSDKVRLLKQDTENKIQKTRYGPMYILEAQQLHIFSKIKVLFR